MALTKREGSLHPPRSEWNPPGELLTAEQRVMLCGPSKCAHITDILSMEDARTGRSVVYRTASSETSMQSCSSIVAVTSESVPPAVGSVTSLFEHTFAGQCRMFAKVALLDNVMSDGDTCMWFASNCTSTFNIIVLLQDLQKPLLVAKNEESMFFLDL